jgi:hypothetical protein
MSNLDTSIPALVTVLERFHHMSGQRIKLSKSAVVLLGADAERPTSSEDANDPQRLWPGMTFSTVGIVVAKYHGVYLTNGEGVTEQWEKKATEVREMIRHDAEVFTPRSIEGRQHLARGRYLGRLTYTFKYQVPEQSTVDRVLQEVQGELNEVVIGKRTWVEMELARQRKEDAGLGLVDAHSTLRATWAYTLRRALEAEPRPWKHFVRYHLRRAYGPDLGAGTQLLTSNYTYATICALPRGAITEKMRQAFKGYGAMPRLRAAQGRTAARTPSQPHDVAYYVLRAQDSVATDIGPPRNVPAAMRPHWRPPPIAQQIAETLTEQGSPWMITATTDVQRAFLEAHDAIHSDRTGPQSQTSTIVAVALGAVEGTTIDVSNESGQTRHVEGRQRKQLAQRRRALLIHGDAAHAPHIPPAAIVASIDAADLRMARVGTGADLDLRLKAIPTATKTALRQMAAEAHEEARARTIAPPPAAPVQHVHRKWRVPDVERQLLWHNSYYADGARVSARSDMVTEQMARRWADEGVVHVRHVPSHARQSDDDRRILHRSPTPRHG